MSGLFFTNTNNKLFCFTQEVVSTSGIKVFDANKSLNNFKKLS